MTTELIHTMAQDGYQLSFYKEIGQHKHKPEFYILQAYELGTDGNNPKLFSYSSIDETISAFKQWKRNQEILKQLSDLKLVYT